MASKGLLPQTGAGGGIADGKAMVGSRDLGALSLNLSKVSAGAAQISARGVTGAADAFAPTSRLSTRDLNPIGGPSSARGQLGTLTNGQSLQLGVLPSSATGSLKAPSTFGKAPLPAREPAPRLPLDAPRSQRTARAIEAEAEDYEAEERQAARSKGSPTHQRRDSLDSAAEAKEESHKATKGVTGGKHRASDSKATSGPDSPTSTDASGSPRGRGLAGAEPEVRREAREQASKPDLDTALEKQREGARSRASLAVRLDTETLAANNSGHHVHRLILQATGEAALSRLSKVVDDTSGWAARASDPQHGYSALHLACYLDRRDVVRLLLSQWTEEIDAWYQRRVKALQARLQACATTSTAYDASVVLSIREWVTEEISRLGRVRELRCEDLWTQALTCRDREGRTPLHYACARGSVSAAVELLSVGMGNFAARTHTASHEGITGLAGGTQQGGSLFPRNRTFHPHSGAIVQCRERGRQKRQEAGAEGEAGLLPLSWVWKRLDLCVRTRLAQRKGHGRTVTTSLLSLFEDYDPKGTGAVTEPDFHRVLRELGLDLTEETQRCLAKLFQYHGDKRRQAAVNYDKLVRMFQSEEGLPSAAPKVAVPDCVDEAEPKSLNGEVAGHKNAQGKREGEEKPNAASKEGQKEEQEGGGKKTEAAGLLGEPKAGQDGKALDVMVGQEQQEGQGAVSVAQLLERRRSLVMDATDKQGYSPLHLAVVHAHVDLVRLLLKHGATQELRSTRGDTALSLAWSPVIQKVLTAALVNKLGDTGASGLQLDSHGKRSIKSTALAASQACSKSQVEACMKVLVESGFRLSEPLGRIDCRAALHVSAITASLAVSLSLLEQDVDVNGRDANGWTALHYCAFLASQQHYTLAKALLEAGADAGARSKSQRTPLHLACMQRPEHKGMKTGQLQGAFNRALFVTLLAGYDADIDARDSKGCTPLHLACEAGDLRCLAALTDSGAHLFARTATGANAAHLAVTSRRRHVLRFLCEADAEERRLLRMRDRAGRTPLELCVDEDVRASTRNVWEASGRLCVEDVKALLLKANNGRGGGQGHWPAAGLDSKTARSGYTAVHMAIRGTAERLALAGGDRQAREQAERDGKRMAAFLLFNDAFVDSLDKLCRTPLMLACAMGLSTIVSLLLSKHADAGATDIDGNCALHHAYAHSKVGLVAMLEAAGGDAMARNVKGQVPEDMLGAGERGLRLTPIKGPAWQKGKGKGQGKRAVH